MIEVTTFYDEVRRYHPTELADMLVSVQPMQATTGRIFKTRLTYARKNIVRRGRRYVYYAVSGVRKEIYV